MENNESILPFPPTPLLTLKTCTIRPYHVKDAESSTRHANNPHIAQWMTNFFPHPYTLEKAHEWIAMNVPKPANTNNPVASLEPAAQQPTSTPPTAALSSGEPPVVWPATMNYAICIDDECVGGIGLKPGIGEHARSAELGYWLGETVWGRGVATEAATAYVAWVFENVPHLERLSGFVYSGNLGSQRVLEKVGFTKEGALRKSVWKWGVWRDLVLYGLLRSEWEERK
ncbi:hypothetical protein SLS57_001118 [Botryosphaeria dothidea]